MFDLWGGHSRRRFEAIPEPPHILTDEVKALLFIAGVNLKWNSSSGCYFLQIENFSYAWDADYLPKTMEDWAPWIKNILDGRPLANPTPVNILGSD